MEHRFDELAKALAEGMPRREALRRLGGGLASLLLASLDVERSWGQGSSDVAHFCNKLPPGPQRGECVREGIRGAGLFEACEGNPNRLCLSRFSHAAFCCPPAHGCLGGECSPHIFCNEHTGEICGAGEQCCKGGTPIVDFCVPSDFHCCPITVPVNRAVACEPEDYCCIFEDVEAAEASVTCCRTGRICCTGHGKADCCPAHTTCCVPQARDKVIQGCSGDEFCLESLGECLPRPGLAPP